MKRFKSGLLRVICLCLSAVTAFAMAGCAGQDSAPKPALFDVLDEGGITADTIDYYRADDIGYECFVAGQNGKYRTVDETGKDVSNPVYDGVAITPVYYEDTGTTKWALAANIGDDMFSVSKNGEVAPILPNAIGFEEYCTVYWNGEEPVMLVYDFDIASEKPCDFNTYYSYEFIAEDAYMSFPGRANISRVIPVREIKELKHEESYGIETAVPVLNTEKYGLFSFDTMSMLTGFVYDDCTAFAVDGVFAAKKGDKWGYISDSGRELTDFCFDMSFPVKAYESIKRQMFLPANGYIVTKRDGKYGLISTSGETVAENEYEYLSQVNPNGIFWAKKNGGWSRLKIKETQQQP